MITLVNYKLTARDADEEERFMRLVIISVLAAFGTVWVLRHGVAFIVVPVPLWVLLLIAGIIGLYLTKP